MISDQFIFWMITITGGVVAGWWLAVRPGASMRAIATPVSVLVILMAVLLCMLAVTGQDLRGFGGEVYDMIRH